MVERLYGSVDDIEVQYRIASIDISGQWDYHRVQYSSVTLSSHQVTASITVQVTFCFTLSVVCSSFSGSCWLGDRKGI